MAKSVTVCRQNKNHSFEITHEDQTFYQKMGVPPPTLCPDCRQQRRLAFRNERHLYNRKCDRSGKQIISIYSSDKPFTVYAHEEWWSDTWDGAEYGRDFDFNRSFFEQYAELQKVVPCLPLYVLNSENSDYCNYVGNVKNSYLIFGSVYSEDCYYGSPYYSRNCLDTLTVRECERCYECVDCRQLYECFYCQDCHSSRNLVYCFDLVGCSDCIGCAGLRNKKHCVFNQQYSEQEYHKIKTKLNLCDTNIRVKLAKELQKLKQQIPHRYMQSKQVENVSGNYVFQCKNVHHSYYTDRSEDCQFCAQVLDLRDCQDINFTEENELCYEYLGAYQNTRTVFSKFCNKVHNSFYCDSCFVAKNLFGCSGLRQKQYCILNKQYRKEEYEKLVPQIVAHMRTTGEWGEFFPLALSPFGYNETVANEYFPLSRQDAFQLGAKWQEEDISNRYEGPRIRLPDNIREVSDDILKQVLTCETCGKNYRLILQELKFYRDTQLAVPKDCPNCRHLARMALRNPRKLWDRQCMQCATPIQTTYAPARPETVYCEKCYQEAVY